VEFKDYYKVMGVARDATDAQIKQAYRKLARKYHPDVSKEKDAEARFKELGEAYEVLKTPEKRAAYDQLGQGPRPGENFRPPPDWGSGFEFSGAGDGASDRGKRDQPVGADGENDMQIEPRGLKGVGDRPFRGVLPNCGKHAEQQKIWQQQRRQPPGLPCRKNETEEQHHGGGDRDP